ncbi:MULTISPECIES: hypothetical protein [unclassified Streptomyces]|uniref:hypothetical protein n=1 Tax=unclassified Streptomyces TaxID=2593676 RepID=UPI00131C96DA|nr:MULTISPECIES: hypothetical protein [unclassified Streptomyces]
MNLNENREVRDTLVRLVLLELCKQADDGVPGENSAPRQGGRPSGRPPAGGSGVFTSTEIRALDELSVLISRTVSGAQSEALFEALNPAEMRRCAELFELLEHEELSYHWWSKAALAGDQDAKEYLEVLIEEREEVVEVCAENLSFPRSFEALKNVALYAVGRKGESGTCNHISSKDVDRLVQEIEENLKNPGQVVDGGRGI